MNDTELLDEYHSLQEDFNKLHGDISRLISSLGDHPSFSLPPVSIFIAKLKEVLDGQNNK